jgi:glycosyltransferase involved in cell wall biosynthesis
MADRRILFVSSRLAYPLRDGMALRQFHLLRAYAGVARVDLAFFYVDAGQLEGVHALKPYCASFHPVPLSTAYRGLSADAPLWRRRVEQALTTIPALGLRSPEMRQVVERQASLADLVHVAKLWMIPSIPKLTGKTGLVLDLDDVETVVKSRTLRINPPPRWQRRLFERYDQVRLRLYQSRAIRSADRVFVCAAKDRQRLGSRNIVVIPNGAVVPPQILPDESDGKTLLCAGSLSYGPNVDGLRFFMRETLPLIRSQIPDVRLLIIGRTPEEEVLKLQDGERIQVVGNVPAVEPFYRRATISLVSLRIAGGTRLRILEAFALGRAVVSTSIGCEGLEVTNGQHILISDDPRQFADSCVALLRRPELRRALVRAARKVVEEKYKWESIERKVGMTAEDLMRERDILKEATKRRPSPGEPPES